MISDSILLLLKALVTFWSQVLFLLRDYDKYYRIIAFLRWAVLKLSDILDRIQ
jgi:hypothetical protein